MNVDINYNSFLFNFVFFFFLLSDGTLNTIKSYISIQTNKN